MEKFEILKAKAAPLPIVNIDTDMIIPKQFLKTIKRSGLGKSLFFEMRFDGDGNKIDDFILNQDDYTDAEILVAGDNFGCGSSREHAPWALLDFGIKSIISTSFADIFYNNSFKNGILPIILKADEVAQLLEDAAEIETANLTINLPDQKVIRSNGEFFEFEIDAFRKKCLLEGLDDIGLTMLKEDLITSYEEQVSQARPWA